MWGVGQMWVGAAGLAVVLAACERVPSAVETHRLAAAVATAPLPKLANPLDAPIRLASADTPTVASEIRRGWSAAYPCADLASSPRFRACLENVTDREGAAVVDARPFKLGLHLGAWQSAPKPSLGALSQSYEADGLAYELHLTPGQVESALPDHADSVRAMFASLKA